MKVSGWGLLALGLVFIQAGCVVDSVYNQKERDAATLSEEYASLRMQYNDLKQSYESSQNRQDVDATSVALELQKQLEALGIVVTAKGGVIRATLANSILFDPGQTKFKSGATRALDEIARILAEKFKDNYIRVEGHTDNVPVNKVKNLYPTNWELSSARALVVLRHIVSKGINSEKIHAAAFGENQPADTNSTESGRSHNRRVEIVILPNLEIEKQKMR